MDIFRALHLRHDDEIEVVPRRLHDLDQITIEKRRIERVDAEHPQAGAEIEMQEGRDDIGPTRLLLARRNGVFEIDADRIGSGRRRLLDHPWVRRGHEQDRPFEACGGVGNRHRASLLQRNGEWSAEGAKRAEKNRKYLILSVFSASSALSALQSGFSLGPRRGMMGAWPRL